MEAKVEENKWKCFKSKAGEKVDKTNVIRMKSECGRRNYLTYRQATSILID